MEKIDKIKVNGVEYSVGGVTETKVDELINAKGYKTESEINTLITNKGYQTASQVETQINTKLGSVYKVKGSVATYSDLPKAGNTNGDVYDVLDTGDNYVWVDNKWDKLSGNVDLSAYVKNTDLEAKGYQTKSQVDSNIIGRGFITNTTNAFNYNNLSNKPTIPTNNNQLTNGKGYTKVEPLTTMTGTEIKGLKVDGTPYKFSSGGSYTLPTASASVKGGIKVGSGLKMTGDVLSALGGGGSGGVKLYSHEVEFADAGRPYFCNTWFISTSPIAYEGTLQNICDQLGYEVISFGTLYAQFPDEESLRIIDLDAYSVVFLSTTGHSSGASIILEDASSIKIEGDYVSEITNTY